MAGSTFTSPPVSLGDITFNGGLNSNSGPLSLKDNEASEINNIEFNRSGSIKQREGYSTLSTQAAAHTSTGYGLHWYETSLGGSYTAYAITVDGSANNARVRHAVDIDNGPFTDITGTVSLSNAYHDFTNFLNECYITAESTAPFKWTGGGNAVQISTPANLQWAKYSEEFNNYLFLANCKVGDTFHNSRIYWSTLKNTNSWTATNFIDIGKNDGQAITRIKKLGDRLVVYKSRSIYNVFFTGDVTIPFILPGGGKSNSQVGCIAPFSIQEVNNGHIFLASDGIYYYDGTNSTKLSERISSQLQTYSNSQLVNAPSLVYKKNNQYWCGFTVSGSSTNGEVIVWDYFNNAFTRFTGMEPSSMATLYDNESDERPYFMDYGGLTYRADNGTDDYPNNTQTAITSDYKTNWRAYNDLMNKKGVPSVTLYHQIGDTLLNFSYFYDLDNGVVNTQSVDLSTSSDVYGTAQYGSSTYAREGGNIIRRDLTGRGRLAKFGFGNNRLGETFQIDGMGTKAYLETDV